MMSLSTVKENKFIADVDDRAHVILVLTSF